MKNRKKVKKMKKNTNPNFQNDWKPGDAGKWETWGAVALIIGLPVLWSVLTSLGIL